VGYVQETFSLPKDFPFDLFRTGASAEPSPLLHRHDCLELNYAESGGGRYHIEDRIVPIEAGDVFVINDLEPHMAVSDGTLSLLVVIFDPSLVWSRADEFGYLQPFFQRNLRFTNRIRPGDGAYDDFRSAILAMETEWREREEGYRLVIKSRLLLLLALLSRHFGRKGEIGADVREYRESYERIRPAVDLIHERFAGELRLADLAAAAAMSGPYLSTFFRKVMGVTVSEYLDSVRTNRACMLLKSTAKPITEVAYESGFNSSSYFNRVFKASQGVSPREYRAGTKESANSREES